MNLHEHFTEIRAAYAQALPEWMADFHANGNMWNDPYIMDWVPHFSPIERLVWGDIREQALPFYPQMPALSYFIDFGNPFLKIGIECDGKAWHDKERDAKRDLRLSEAGWTIYRIEGHECKREVNIHEDDSPDIDRYYSSTSDGVLRAIKHAYFDGDIQPDSSHLVSATLFNHRSTPDMVRPTRAIPKTDGPVLIGDMLLAHRDTLLARMQRK